MNYDRPEYFITTDPDRLDFDYICRSLHTTHWGRTRPDEVIVASFRHSLCFGVFEKTTGRQIGFARVITDTVIRSLVEDVFIDEAYRGKGLGKWLVACLVAHPQVSRTKCRLTTRDAHGLYAKFGFEREEVMRRYPGPLVPGPEPGA